MASNSKSGKECNCVCHRPSSAGLTLCDKCKSQFKQNKIRKTPRRQRRRRQRKSKSAVRGAIIPNPYSRNIHRLLKCLHPDLSITRKAVNVMNSFFIDLLDRIATEASTLVYLGKKSTMAYNDIISATKLVITTPELCDLAVGAAESTIEWWENH